MNCQNPGCIKEAWFIWAKGIIRNPEDTFLCEEHFNFFMKLNAELNEKLDKKEDKS